MYKIKNNVSGQSKMFRFSHGVHPKAIKNCKK